MTEKYLFSVVFFFMFIFAALAEDHVLTVIDKFTVENGMSNNYVSGLLRGKNGFLWISTRNNLTRYDGRDFKSYQGSIDNIKNAIYNIRQDRCGNIWYLCDPTDLIELKPYNKTYKKISYKYLGITGILGFDIDKNDLIWIHNRDGNLYVLDKKNNKVVRILSYKDIAYIDRICVDSFSNLLISGSEGLFKLTYDFKSIMEGKCQTIPLIKYSEQNMYPGVKKIFLPSKNETWFQVGHYIFICTDNYTKIQKTDIRNIVPGSANAPIINTVVAIKGPENKVLIATSSGIATYSEKAGFHIPHLRDIENRKLPPFAATDIYIQENGMMWVGSDDGLYRISISDDFFKSFYYPESENEAGALKIRCISEIENDTFLIGINNKGLQEVAVSDKGLCVIKKFSSDPNNQLSPGNNTINTIYKDNKGNIWIGANGFHLNRFNKLNGTFKKYDVPFVWSLCEGDKGTLWAGTSIDGGPYAINTVTDEVNRYPIKDKKGKEIPDIKIFNIIAKGKLLWFSTNKGVYTFDPEKKSVIYIYPELEKTNTERAWATVQYSDSIVFISTESGLRKFNTVTGHLSVIPSDPDIFYGCQQDHAGCLWLVTDRGLAKYDPKGNRFTFYNKKDNLITNNFSFVGSYKRENGDLVFAGEQGFNIIHPKTDADAQMPSNVNICNFKIFDHEIYDNIKNRDTIALNYDQNFISFDFAAADLDIDQKAQYAFLLDGFDDQWRYVSKRQSAFYTGLREGTYTFKVKCTNAAGHWADIPTTVILMIKPPFWRTWWFYSFSGGGTLFFLGGLVVLNIRNIKRKHEKDRLVIESEIKALRSQMNPHFIFNSLNAIQHFILNNEKKDANMYLSKFANLIREILDYSSRQNITVEEETGFLANYLDLESLRLEKRLTWRIDIKDRALLSAKIPTLVLQPIVENAVVHGIAPKKEGGNINITVQMDKNMICCTIEDDGVGISSPRKRLITGATHESKGLDLIKRRLLYLGQQYKADSRVIINEKTDALGNVSGTKVIVYLPNITHTT